MRQTLVTALLLVLCLGSLAQAEKIELKKSFFTGWKYSVDGLDYKGVGGTGKSLREAMEGNESAQMEMDRFASAKTIATVTGLPGGFLLGWPLGATLAGKEWTDSYTTMYMIGVPLSILSIVYGATANKRLKRAVSIYNGEEQSLGLDVRWQRGFATTDRGSVVVGLAWRF